MGYNFVLEYNKVIENKIADALSWKGQERGALMLISFLNVNWDEDLKTTYDTSPQV